MSRISNAKKEKGEYTEARHRRDLRDELKAIIDYAFDSWEDIEREAQSAGRGFVTGGSEPSGGEDAGSVVEMAAFKPPDAGEHAKEWLAMAQEVIGHVRALERKAWLVLPNTGDEGRRKGERKSTVEVCKRCGNPILDGRLHRIDNEPYHKTTCYYQEHRERQRAAVNPVRDVDVASVDELRARRELPPGR